MTPQEYFKMVWKPSSQLILSVMIFWGQIQNYMMRVNLTILIVAMVDQKSARAASNITTPCGETKGAAKQVQGLESTTKFEWDEFTQGLVLASFSYGYWITQIVGGRLAERFGTKRVYGLCMLMVAFLTFLSPPVAKLGHGYFMALRAAMGLFQGVTFPSLHAFTARWVEPNRRSSFIARFK